MNRRNFFTTATVLSAVPVFSSFAGSYSLPKSEKGNVISEIEFWEFSGMRNPSEGFVGWIQSKPSQVFNNALPDPANWKEETGKQPYSALYIKIITKDGPEGIYGPIDKEAAIVVENQLKTVLIGMDALAGEMVWEKLFRNNRHSRAGHYMMAISAVDNALWDLRGKYFNVPVYKLLGGPTRNDVEFYGSCLGFSIEPEAVKQRCLKVQKMGFRSQKWFFAYGSGDGPAGLIKNIELVKVLRETLGNETDLMFDTFMGWDLDLATAWAKEVEQYRPRWLEEPFMPNQLESYEKLAEETSVPIATGEHLYNRWEVLEYLKTKSLSVVQADPEWCGGVSELVKICSLASAYGVQVIPHGHNLTAAMHVIASQSPAVCPVGEYLINKMDNHFLFEKNPPSIVNGRIALNNRPGFGIEWDESKIQKKQKVSFI
jgi:L-rhamnonate dehydratase